ncbi:MAG: hypothetical protein IPM82_05635 [Saprospiraceae bacterium]|nr:hypothetical protein [Saprospiraceae bacterium]
MHPGDKFFSLEFALLDFQSPVSYYKYQIEGFDKEWQYIKNHCSALVDCLTANTPSASPDKAIRVHGRSRN